jgi:hypothetical protein
MKKKYQPGDLSEINELFEQNRGSKRKPVFSLFIRPSRARWSGWAAGKGVGA